MPLVHRFAAALALFSMAAAAQDYCPDCASAFSMQPAVLAWLASSGFPPSDYEVLVTWTETTADRKPVYGYRLRSRASGKAFDVYSDETGLRLDSSELERYGVRPKSWNAIAIETHAETALGASIPVAPGPKSAELAVPPAIVRLPKLDPQTLLQHDADDGVGDKGVLRTGVFQVFSEPLEVTAARASHGTWHALPGGGRAWAATIVSPEAVGQRIRFTEIDLPPNGYLVVYNTDNPEERYGPFTQVPPGDSSFWSPTCFNESVTVEIVVPGAGDVDVRIDRIVHMYRRLDELPWGGPKVPAGACNLDVACYAGWLNVANGVAGIGSVGSAGSMFCTGTLVVDTDPATQIPYFLTANHCVPNAGDPNSIEVYWFYQRDSCGGTVPPILSVPRTTGGADLLATSYANIPNWTGTDFTLLRLRNTPPAGATFVGWTSVAQTTGLDTVCIHHPRGDYKRITFGDYTNSADGCFAGTPPPATKYYQSTWNAGTTEGGSSGSPLLHGDSQRIIGQLWGGYASCAQPTCPDYYGRFDVSYPLMEAYLNAEAAARTVQFTPASANVGEGDGQVTLTLTLSSTPYGGETVEIAYSTAQATAKASADYAESSGVIAFTELQDTAIVAIPVLEDGQIEGGETFEVTLADPIGCTIGANGVATVTIVDNDVDTDGDTLSDYDETNATFGYVTNPANPDTDGDSVDDWLELVFGFDPTNGSEFPAIPSLAAPWFK